jgi:hypothetical protein
MNDKKAVSLMLESEMSRWVIPKKSGRIVLIWSERHRESLRWLMRDQGPHAT